MSAITSITVQTTLGIQEFYDVPASIVEGQIDAVMNDFQPEVVKIGLIRKTDTLEAVVRALRKYKPRHVILDAVVLSSHGDMLISREMQESISCLLLPLCTLIIKKEEGSMHGLSNRYASAVAVFLSQGIAPKEAEAKAKSYINTQVVRASDLQGRSSELYNEFLDAVAEHHREASDVRFYADLLKAMVEGWRAEWKQGDFPFYYCQIAPYDYSLIGWEGSQYLREQQLKAETIIPNARMAVLMDAGLEYGIHPRKKRQAGERLALLALSNTYGVKGLPDFATYKDVVFEGDTAFISFDRSKEWVYFEHGTTSKNFEVAGADRVFHPATKVWTSRNKVYVQCDKVKQPAAVRYAWHDWADGDLMHDGLPVSSFRTDDWDVEPAVNETKGDYNEAK